MPDRAHSTARLDALLADAADPATRAHWERYLRGSAAFRGVPMAAIRRAVATTWAAEGLAAWTTDDLLSLAGDWFARAWSEDRLAAVLLIGERLAGRLRTADSAALRAPLARRDVSDWNVADWYAVKALHAFLVADAPELEARARALAGWTTGDELWERRAALVAFVALAARAEDPFPGFTCLVLDACAANLVSDDRFAHTGPGWVLREPSSHRPDAVRQFVAEHPGLSPEGRRMATARLREGP